MGLLNLFSKPAPALLGLPSGSFTLDRSGRVVIATLSSNFPPALVMEIGRHVLTTLRDAVRTEGTTVLLASHIIGDLTGYHPGLCKRILEKK